MAVQPIQTLKIFYCYAQEDDALREQLARHLSPLRRLRYITGWYNRDIRAGATWERESEMQLHEANIILLLISSDFFASDYCYTVEMQHALEMHRAGTACVIPILLRPVEWEKTPIGELAALPSDKVPVTQWADQDKAWLNVVQGINEVIRNLLSQQQLSAEDNDILSLEHGPLSGQTVGSKYLLGALIGEGGFSQVYKAQHLLVGRQQAIKVLLEHHLRKRAFRDRFLREAQTVAFLDHAHIIHLDDFWVETSQAYLVMPFIGGGTLQDILDQQQGFLPTDRLVFYLEQICAALDYAHQHGVVHLDLKPLNLLVHQNDKILLSDFGLAHLMKQGAIAGGSSLRIGTPHYMAPEHIQGSPEKRSDLFSLGVILYQMLLGRLPFEGSPSEAIIFKNITAWPAAPRTIRPDLPKSVEDMLAKAIAKQPEQRYQSANEFLLAFKHALEPTPHANVHQQSQHINTPDVPAAIRSEQAGKLILRAAANPSSDRSLPVEILGERYQLQDPIGRGGMATIYRARDTRMDRTVAIKVLREVYSTDPKFVTRFQREAKAASSLQHPNIVQVYDSGQSNGNYFIVMELIDGTDLRRYLRSRGILAAHRAIIIAHDIALGMGAAHRRGIVHRDVRPQNVLVGRDGSIKLTDFGIVSIYKSINDERLTTTGMTLGHVSYFAPEQAQGEIVSPAADVYSLGISLYEMMTGRTPFDGDTPVAVAMAHIQDPPTPPSHLNPNIPPALEEIILRCLEKVPEMRYRDGNALARALEALGDGALNSGTEHRPSN